MTLTRKQILAIIFTGILLLILPVALFLSQKRQDIRPKASSVVIDNVSTLTFVGPNKVKVGEKFSVDVILDATNDRDFTISSADAIISINPMGYNPPTPPTCRTDRTCPAYDLSPDFCKGGKIIQSQIADICGCAPPPTCIMPIDDKQLNVTSVTEPDIAIGRGQEGQYYPKPPYYSQSISLVNISPGKIFDNYSYPGSSGSTCGGIAGLKCPDGYYCSYGGVVRDGYPDQSGTCISNSDKYPPPLVGTGGTGSSSAGGSAVSVTGSIVDMSKLPTPGLSVECPAFPGCPPEGSLMPWNICWGDAAKLCPSSTYKKEYGGIIGGTGDAACIQDAKQCPDGSWVGRTGPNCEFAACSGKPIPITSIPNPPDREDNKIYWQISGKKNFAVDEKGYFKGFTGKGTFATLNFVAQYPGKVEIGFIPGTNIKGYLISQPASSQEPKERLLANSPNLSLEVVSDKTCRPRPDCLDNPLSKCDPQEPVGGWCPPPKPTCTPRPPCVDGIKQPDGTIQYCALDMLPGGWLCPKTTITPHPGCYRKKEGDANCDGQIDGLDYSAWLNTQCNPGSNQKCGDTRGDFNNDGKVDDEDYKIWFNSRR